MSKPPHPAWCFVSEETTSNCKVLTILAAWALETSLTGTHLRVASHTHASIEAHPTVALSYKQKTTICHVGKLW